MINGYKNRCIEVQTKNGKNEKMVRAVCDCEGSVLNDNFSTFELMMIAAADKSNNPLLSKEKTRDFMHKIKACEKRI